MAPLPRHSKEERPNGKFESASIQYVEDFAEKPRLSLSAHKKDQQNENTP